MQALVSVVLEEVTIKMVVVLAGAWTMVRGGGAGARIKFRPKAK